MIKLTLTSVVLKDEVDLRIKELSKNKSKKDEDEKDEEWYTNMGLPIPRHLLEEDDLESVIEDIMDDDDNFVQLESPLYVKGELIDLIIGGDEKENTLIFMTSNKSYNVKETAEEVYKLIELFKLKST